MVKSSTKDLREAFFAGITFQQEFVINRFSNLVSWGMKVERPNPERAFELFIERVPKDGKKEKDQEVCKPH